MADPLSITASVAGLLALAEYIISTSVTYFHSVHSGPCNFQSLVGELSNLKILLDGMKNLARRLDNSPACPASATNLTVQLQICTNTLILPLVEHLTKSVAQAPFSRGRLVARLLWPLRETETSDYLQKLERWKSAFEISLHGVDLEMNLSIEEVNKREREQRQQHQRDKKFGVIMQWLSAINCATIHNTISQNRHPATGSWIFVDLRFQEWQQANNSFLWINGIPGAGKSVLLSTIIGELSVNLPADHGFAYFYCVHNDPDRRDPIKLLSTLVAQLCLQSQDFYNRVKDIFDSRTRTALLATAPNLQELCDILISGSTDFAQITLVIDALDECEVHRTQNQSKLFGLLRKLGGQTAGAIKVLATSRPEPDIRIAFQGLSCISLEGSEVAKDIETYLHSELNERLSNKQLKLRDADTLHKQIISALTDRAGGMFLYVKCQLDYLCDMRTDDDIMEALQQLPRDIHEVYERILQRLDNENKNKGARDLGQKIIRYIAGAVRPLTLDELAELVSIKKGQRELRLAAVATDPTDLAHLCGSLIRINWETQEIFLAHFSVKEFLVSEAIMNSSVKQYYVGISDVDAELAKISFTYLLFKDFAGGTVSNENQLADRVNKYKFLGYAASCCGTHLRVANADNQEIMELVDQFFVPPTKIEDYTDDTELRGLLTQITFTCQLIDGFTKYQLMNKIDAPKLVPSFDLNEIDEDPTSAEKRELSTSLSESLIVPSELKTILTKILSTVRSNTANKANMLSWLQVARFKGWTQKEHPANITPLYFASLVGWQAGVEKILDTTYSGVFKSPGDLNLALGAAALLGWPDIIDLLLKSGANIRAHTEDFGSALQAASSSGCIEAVELLVQRGARVEESNNFFRSGGSVGSALGGAVSRGDKRMVSLLLKGNKHGGGDINDARGFGGTPLMRVIQQPDMVQFLLDNGADPSTPGGLFGGPLLWADGDLLEMLANNIPSVSSIDRRVDVHGDALQAAAFRQSSRKVKILLEKGANPNARCGQYGNAIQAAATRGDADIAKLLLEYGADPNSPAECIWNPGGSETPSIAYHGKVVQFLEGQGWHGSSKGAFFGPLIKSAVWLADAACNSRFVLLEKEPTNQLNHYGNPLQAACISGNVATVNLLLEKGVEVNTSGGMYGNALQGAIVHGHMEVTKLLLAKNACPNQRGGYYHNALQGAATVGKWDMVDLLIHAGADKEIVDEHGWTPGLCASHFHNHQLFPGQSKSCHISPLRPSAWSSHFRSPKLEIDDKSLEAMYCGEEDVFSNITAAVRADHPIPPNSSNYYFEVEIIDSGESGAVGLGIFSELTPLHRMPGWDEGSHGYHGDDGKVFSNGKCVFDFLRYGTKDTVGCGVNWGQSICYFTLNGSRVEDTIQIEKGKFYPTVGIISKGGHIRVNFGGTPFMYDIQSLGM